MRRRRNQIQKPVILGSMMALLLFMSVGYAAFSTKLDITAKGHITGKDGMSIPELKAKYCNATEGDGLYVDTYEEGRCVYRGGNPNNYIAFNDETWRILSVEKDKTSSEDKWFLKIMKAEALPARKFDSKGARTTGYCSQEEAPTYGCNAWVQTPNFTNGQYSGAVDKDSELNTYLNNDYYNTLSTDVQSQIVSHTWNIGAVLYTETNLANSITSEKSITSNNKIGLPTATEYVKASINSACTSLNAYFYTSSCYDNSQAHNWIYNIAQTSSKKYLWLLSPLTGFTSKVFHVTNVSGLYPSNANYVYGVAPTLYLKSDIKLSGEGTEGNPYTIVS